MTDEQIKKNIAENMTALRKAKGLTQAELAEKLNYSDKSVSKWERGDGTPDIIVLSKIAALFEVTLDEMVSDKTPVKKPQKRLPHLTNRIIIPLLSVGLVFLVVSVVFFLLNIFTSLERTWLLFIVAVPVAFIPLIVFTCVWWGLTSRLLSISGLTWSLAVFAFITFPHENMDFAFITAAIFQVLLFLWYIMRFRSKKRKEEAAKTKETPENKQDS